MENLGKYAKRFAIGVAVGLGVWAGMSLFGLTSLIAFAAPNPLTNFIYAGVFFGVIQASLAIMNDIFDAPKQHSQLAHTHPRIQEAAHAPEVTRSKTVESILAQGPRGAHAQENDATAAQHIR